MARICIANLPGLLDLGRLRFDILPGLNVKSINQNHSDQNAPIKFVLSENICVCIYKYECSIVFNGIAKFRILFVFFVFGDFVGFHSLALRFTVQCRRQQIQFILNRSLIVKSRATGSTA